MNINNIVGGAIGTVLKNPTCLITITNSFFLENNSLYGGVAYPDHYAAQMIFKSCIFEKNWAYLKTASYGAGGIIAMSMNSGSNRNRQNIVILITKNCVMRDSGSTVRGIIIFIF